MLIPLSFSPSLRWGGGTCAAQAEGWQGQEEIQAGQPGPVHQQAVCAGRHCHSGPAKPWHCRRRWCCGRATSGLACCFPKRPRILNTHFKSSNNISNCNSYNNRTINSSNNSCGDCSIMNTGDSCNTMDSCSCLSIFQKQSSYAATYGVNTASSRGGCHPQLSCPPRPWKWHLRHVDRGSDTSEC